MRKRWSGQNQTNRTVCYGFEHGWWHWWLISNVLDLQSSSAVVLHGFESHCMRVMFWSVFFHAFSWSSNSPVDIATAFSFILIWENWAWYFVQPSIHLPYSRFCLQGPISAKHQFLFPAVISAYQSYYQIMWSCKIVTCDGVWSWIRGWIIVTINKDSVIRGYHIYKLRMFGEFHWRSAAAAISSTSWCKQSPCTVL